MNSTQLKTDDGGINSAGNDANSCGGAAKWAAVVNDIGIPAPQQKVKVSVLKAQAGVPDNHTLFRDYSPKNDVALHDSSIVDLAEGNMFYSIADCDAPTQGHCSGTPKLAWFVDDRHEVTLRPNQTVESLRDLFQLSHNSHLLRDYESPNDVPLEAHSPVRFTDGPVLIARSGGHGGPVSVTIIVEGTPHVWSKRLISYEEVVKLEVPEYPQSPPLTYSVKYKCGPNDKPEGILPPGASVKVKEGMIFNVSETGQS